MELSRKDFLKKALLSIPAIGLTAKIIKEQTDFTNDFYDINIDILYNKDLPIFVDIKNGNDKNSGRNLHKPIKTLKRAIELSNNVVIGRY